MRKPYLKLSRQTTSLGAIAFLSLGALVPSASTTAQIVPDATLPVNSIVTPEGTTLTITGGTPSGNNLFHSFQEFNLPTGATAFFNHSLDIKTIFSRVTGGSISNIDGLIQTNGVANLFLINPSGIIFGPNASLNVGGSFIATTATGINFADRTEFNTATSNTSAPLLTVSIPVGLQYGNNPNGIQVQGSNLGVQPGKSLVLAGGEIAIAGGQLLAPGGRIELSAVAAETTVGLNVDPANLSVSLTPLVETDIARTDISLSDRATLSVIDSNGGSISLQGRNIAMSGGSRTIAGIQTLLGGANSQAGAIAIDATGSITLTQQSIIGNQVGFDATGNGGDVRIQGDSLTMSEGSQITAIVKNGGGNAGRVSVRVREGVDLTGTGTGLFSSVELGAEVAPRMGTGNSGGIEIEADRISLSNGAQLQSIAQVRGNAGLVSLRANNGVMLTGDNTAIFSQLDFTGTGKSEGIDIEARSLFLSDGAQLISNSLGEGNAGKIFLEVTDAISMTGANTSILNNVSFLGNSEGIEIETGSLSMANGAQLQAIASGIENNAGVVRIQASNSVELSGKNTAIFSTVASSAIDGNSGGIEIEAQRLTMSDGAQAIAATFGEGNAGKVAIAVRENISLSGRNTVIFSSVGPSEREFAARGNSGGVQMRARSLSLTDGAKIVASVFDLQQGNAGSIDIQVQEEIALVGNSDRTSPTPSTKILPIVPVIPISVVDGLFPPSPGEVPTPTPTPSPSPTPTPTTQPPPDTPILGIGGEGATTGIFSTVETGARGNAGNITLQSTTLSVTGGAQVQTLTRGEGNSGNIRVRVSEASIAGVNAKGDFSGFASTVEETGVGNPGDIEIQANALSVSGGAGMQALTRGGGNSGNIRLQVREAVTFSGGSPDGSFASGAFTSSEGQAQGAGGQIAIATDRLQIEDGAVVSARSTTAFAGGEIAVNANTVELRDRGTIVTSATGNGAAGSIAIDAREQIGLRSEAVLSAETANGDRGNISLAAPDTILRDRSRITTNATGTATGGNIIINTDNLVAIDNSDITANAEEASGGQAIVNTQGIFGLRSGRNASATTSDITASSANGPQFDGIVEINAPEVDPTSGLVELPDKIVDASSLVVRKCAENRSERSGIAVTGRGGLPSSPNDAIAIETPFVDLGDRLSASERNNAESLNSGENSIDSVMTRPSRSLAFPEPLVEAQSWEVNEKGEIVLTAERPTVQLPVTRQQCTER